MCQFRCPCDLRRGYEVARLLRMRVRIPPDAWMSVSYECFVLSSIYLRAKPIPRPEEYYREALLRHRGEKKRFPSNIQEATGEWRVGGFRGIPLYSLNLGARGGWVVNAMPQPLYPGKVLLCTKDTHISVLTSSNLANRIICKNAKLDTNKTDNVRIT